MHDNISLTLEATKMILKKILRQIAVAVLASFSTITMAGSFTVCEKNSIKYVGIPFYIAKNMIVKTTINDQSQPDQNIAHDQTVCTDYTFTGLKANVKLSEKFPGTEYYFNWIDLPLLEINDKMTIYICQGLRLGGIADAMIAGIAYAEHWGSATFSKSEWNSWDYKCGKTKADQYWGVT